MRKSGASRRPGGRAAKPMSAAAVKFDCRWFRGHIPCEPNKLRGKICVDCDEYEKITKRILIIKLGAIGDVIRTTPLVEAFRRKHPGCRITWLTLSPDVLPPSLVDEALTPDPMTMFRLPRERFDIAVNLDKEPEPCALLSAVSAPKKFGFTIRSGHIAPATPAAEHKLVTGLFDGLSKSNTKNYLEEIFEICHMKFSGEEYLIRRDRALEERWREEVRAKAGGNIVAGLNTGCGKRWTTRLWPPEYWTELITTLRQRGYFPVLLGGPDEDAQNRIYARDTGAWYPGHFKLPEFIALCASIDVAVTQVSMMMHIAIALRSKLVLMNNIFNSHEFELYGRGSIVEPATGCDCYYGTMCTRERRCMRDLSPASVLAAVARLAP